MADTRTALLAWYDSNGRKLPWRKRKGRIDPYRVWLSEVMLQQTQAATVVPYFNTFIARWPNVKALAGAAREDVLSAWAGLGYYARARNLHAAAVILAERGFPKDEAGWRELPGVGAYTAAAIAAIACGQAANAVDGNIERVISRWFAVDTPLPDAAGELRALSAQFVTDERPGDWVQALMDLGATVCTPKNPKCLLCPVAPGCVALRTGAPAAYPKKRAKPARPKRHGVVFFLERDGHVLRVLRADEGLLGGMVALPTTPWRDAAWSEKELAAHAPCKGAWIDAGSVEHVFTHFSLTLNVRVLRDKRRAGDGTWVRVEDADVGLPTVFRKAVERARATLSTASSKR
jgi:A/G-specific adenine glycosylase